MLALVENSILSINGEALVIFLVPALPIELTSPYLFMCFRYCEDCIAKDASRVITFKAPARKSTRTTNKVDYANLNAGIAGDPRRWFRHLNQKPMKKSPFKRMKGSEVTVEWLQSDENAFTEPIIIEKPEGLGMKMPDASFTVNDVAKLVGPKEKVEVLGACLQLFFTLVVGPVLTGDCRRRLPTRRQRLDTPNMG